MEGKCRSLQIIASLLYIGISVNSNQILQNCRMFGGGDGKKTKFLDYQWNDLPGNARTAATTLGYSESNWAKAWAPAEDKWWEDLNATEKEAAENLGWDMNAWDNHYEECNWSQLPQHVQDAASKLGFTSEMWDNDEWPSSTDKWWSEIPAENRKALNTLGYSKYDWE